MMYTLQDNMSKKANKARERGIYAACIMRKLYKKYLHLEGKIYWVK